MIPTISQLHRVKLEGVNRPLLHQLDSMLRDAKVATAPSGVATVGTTSVLVLGTQANRVFTTITNVSDTDIDIAFGEAAVSGQGARLVADGGVYVIDWENLWQGAVNAICIAANKNLATIDGRTG